MGLFRKIIFTIRAKIFRTRKNLPGSNATLLPVIWASEHGMHHMLMNIKAYKGSTVSVAFTSANYTNIIMSTSRTDSLKGHVDELDESMNWEHRR